MKPPYHKKSWFAVSTKACFQIRKVDRNTGNQTNKSLLPMPSLRCWGGSWKTACPLGCPFAYGGLALVFVQCFWGSYYTPKLNLGNEMFVDTTLAPGSPIGGSSSRAWILSRVSFGSSTFSSWDGGGQTVVILSDQSWNNHFNSHSKPFNLLQSLTIGISFFKRGQYFYSRRKLGCSHWSWWPSHSRVSRVWRSACWRNKRY